MKPLVSELFQKGEPVQELLAQFTRHCNLRKAFDSMGGLPVISPQPYTWEPLNAEGQLAQMALRRQYLSFAGIARALLVDVPPTVLKEFDHQRLEVMELINQERTARVNVAGALTAATGALNDQLALLNRLYPSGAEERLFVVDTNALLASPALEQWRFPAAQSFCILLTPTVSGELDSLKVNHRNAAVRDKAECLIRQIKDYRRRGRLTDGVTLAKDVSSIRALAIEPDVSRSLSWLDPANKDDRFLASVMEVQRAHPRASVCLVTEDLNLQTKAELAAVPFVEPPEPNQEPGRGGG